MKTPNLTYSADDHFLRIEQKCPNCGTVLRIITQGVDCCAARRLCQQCKQTVIVGSVTMRDRFSGVATLNDMDSGTAACLTGCKPWNQEDLVTDEDIYALLEDELNTSQ